MSYLQLASIWWAYFITSLDGLFHCLKDIVESVFSRKPKRLFPSLVAGTFLQKIYTKFIYRSLADCFGRVSALRGPNCTLELEGNGKIYSNFASYDYTNAASIIPPSVNDPAYQLAMTYFPMGRDNCHPQYANLLKSVEHKMAKFIGTESCVLFSTGWETNASAIPILVQRNPNIEGRVLIMSDRLNHASIVMGCKLSIAYGNNGQNMMFAPKIVVFENNSPQDLEDKLKTQILTSPPGSFQRILIVIEGIYSMEGSISNLKEFVRIKTKYKAQLYVDEAHSIGAIGESCKGICEFSGVNPRDVDILMGTFTKSFASIGGYCAGNTRIITYLRKYCHAASRHFCMPYGCLLQINSVLDKLSDSDWATSCARKLLENTQSMRNSLEQSGIKCLGHPLSPVVPIVVHKLTTMGYASRKCLEEGICVVVAGFPATPYKEARIRLCMSSGHTQEQIDHVCKTMSDILIN